MKFRDSTLWIGIFVAGILIYLNRQSMGEAIVSTLSSWKNVGEGPKWIPLIESVAKTHNIPENLLSRVAYQESHFRNDVIRGITPSPAGALGIMQMMPQYFSSVNVPRPYSDADVGRQIVQAASQLASLYASTHSWTLALAAYNAGLGNVKKYGGIPPFPETQHYVTQITQDVPALA